MQVADRRLGAALEGSEYLLDKAENVLQDSIVQTKTMQIAVALPPAARGGLGREGMEVWPTGDRARGCMAEGCV